MHRAPRSQAPRTKTDLMGSDSDEGGVPPEYMYESALQALLSVDIRVDMRGVLKDIITFANFQELSASVQSSLAKLLPEDDQTPDMFEQALRCPQLAEAVREMEESLETVTPEVLQKRENESWSARVGDRCEGRYMAGVDGASQRRRWYPGTIVRMNTVGHFTVRYDDDGEEELAVQRKFLRPPLAVH